MFTYKQKTGEMFHDGNLLAIGYSGHGVGKNNPAMQNVPMVGPCPVGLYSIGAPECVTIPGPHGPFVLRLTPDASDNEFGRAGFLIHGDSTEHPGDASEGCIIMPRNIRNSIAASGDHRLTVIAE